jgi:hypothetical protein
MCTVPESRPITVRIIKLLLLGLVGIVVISVVGVFAYLNLSQDTPHFAGICETLELEGSAEDIQIDRERGFAYLSVIDRGALAAGGDVQGKIMRLDLNGNTWRVEPAIIDPPGHFRPHGLSLFVDDNDLRSLVVINHPVDRGVGTEHVELFYEMQPGQFRRRTRMTLPPVSATYSVMPSADTLMPPPDWMSSATETADLPSK